MKKNLLKKVSRTVAGLSFLLGMVLCAGVDAKAATKVDNNNNTLNTSATINLNTTYAGNSTNADEEDWYRFVIPATAKEGYFNVVFGPEDSNSVTVKSGWRVYVYKKGEAEPFWKSQGIKSKITSDNMPFGPGEYYIKVTSSGYGTYFSDENYNFSVNYSDNAHWETEWNNEMANANSINVNETYHGNLVTYTDEDCYTFTLPKAGEVVVTLGANASEDITKIQYGWNLFLYKNGAADSTVAMKGVKGTTSSAKYTLAAGTYKIRVCGAGYQSCNPWLTTYDFNVSYKETVSSTTAIRESKVTVSSAKSKAKKKVYLKWKKNKYADGYKVYRSTKKKSGYKCIATIKKRSKVSYTDKKVKSKKVYYYKVRAYKKVGKKTIYSGYSPVKRVKVK